MTEPTFAETRRLFVRLWRIRLARLLLWLARVVDSVDAALGRFIVRTIGALAGAAERALPDDLRELAKKAKEPAP